MLPDNEVLKSCRYWATRLMQKGVEFDELVSVGYVVGKPLKDKKLLNKWVHYTILRFIMDSLKSLSQSSALENYDIISGYKEKLDQHITAKDVRLAVDKAHLSRLELKIIVMRFFKDMKLPEIAKVINITPQGTGWRLKQALAKIGRTYQRRTK